MPHPSWLPQRPEAWSPVRTRSGWKKKREALCFSIFPPQLTCRPGKKKSVPLHKEQEPASPTAQERAVPQKPSVRTPFNHPDNEGKKLELRRFASQLLIRESLSKASQKKIHSSPHHWDRAWVAASPYMSEPQLSLLSSQVLKSLHVVGQPWPRSPGSVSSLTT